MPAAVDRDEYEPLRVEMNQRVQLRRRSSGEAPAEMDAKSFGWSPQYWLSFNHKLGCRLGE